MVPVPFMSKWVLYSTLNMPLSKHWCMFVMMMQRYASFVRTTLSQTPQPTPQVTFDAGWISACIFDCPDTGRKMDLFEFWICLERK